MSSHGVIHILDSSSGKARPLQLTNNILSVDASGSDNLHYNEMESYCCSVPGVTPANCQSNPWTTGFPNTPYPGDPGTTCGGGQAATGWGIHDNGNQVDEINGRDPRIFCCGLDG